ncbi:MAG: BLUF domain-containing protein [Pseudomonadota bacterium]
MDTYQLIYSSRPFGYDQATLDGILLDARRCNARDDITGALVCRQDVFIQMLEGPRDAVQHTFDRIRRDDRHVEVSLRHFSDCSARMFGAWAMLHDPAQSWLWSRSEIAQGVLDQTGVAGFMKVFEMLSDNMATIGAEGR